MERGTSENCTEEMEPRFCTIIYPGLNTEILKIPQKFQEHILNELSEKALLKIKDSVYCAWNIRVHQTESGIYLKEGWREFLEDHKVGDGEALVFRYDGHMQFSIQIFGKNHVERVDFNYLENETHGNPSLANNSELNGGEEEDYQDGEEEEDATVPKSEVPSFASIIGPRIYNVVVPVDFSRKHLPRGHYDIVLKNSEGRKWKVNVVPSSSTVQLSGGLKGIRDCKLGHKVIKYHPRISAVNLLGSVSDSDSRKYQAFAQTLYQARRFGADEFKFAASGSGLLLDLIHFLFSNY